MRLLTVYIVLFGLLPKLSTAQGASGTDNPLTVPACSTLLSIVGSCESKLLDANTITASVFSCFCFDGSGKYAPALYDNAVAGCSSALPQDSTDFDFWLPGFCTASNLATGLGAASTTTAMSTTAGVGTTGGGTVIITSATPSPTPNPGGFVSTSTSNRTSTSAPTSTTAGAAGHVSSTSSKAEGVKVGYFTGEASLLSILGSILGAIMVF